MTPLKLIEISDAFFYSCLFIYLVSLPQTHMMLVVCSYVCVCVFCVRVCVCVCVCVCMWVCVSGLMHHDSSFKTTEKRTRGACVGWNKSPAPAAVAEAPCMLPPQPLRRSGPGPLLHAVKQPKCYCRQKTQGWKDYTCLNGTVECFRVATIAEKYN